MTVHIKGRTRYADGPTTKVTISRYAHDEPILVIEGGLFEFRSHDRSFVIGAKHPTATDEEHDASYVAYLEGAGFTFDMMNPSGFDCYAAIFKARFYDEEPVPEGACDRSCEEPHGFLKFTPPKQDWKPANFWIRVEFLSANEPEDPDVDAR
jgi:hypothetical protein